MNSLAFDCSADGIESVTVMKGDWDNPENAYRVFVVTMEEEDGSYSTIAVNLPGAGSCGQTKEESMENAKEAIKASIESYLEAGESIPWKKNDMGGEFPAGEKKIILIHV